VRLPTERLRDILEAIEHIERYTVQGRTAFDRDELIQNWVVRHLQIVGEAANALPEAIRMLDASVPWRSIIGMRHILVHHYFVVDLAVTWEVVETHLPNLKRAVSALLSQLEQP
jgi:uncharacterized protein with HEPN domain